MKTKKLLPTMRIQKKSVLRLVLSAFFTLTMHHILVAQFTPFVMRTSGTPCTGSEQVFTYIGESYCTINSASGWLIGGGGVIVTTTQNTVFVRWDQPTTNASVVAMPSMCQGASFPQFTVSSFVTPSVSIAIESPAGPICQPQAVTFKATPVNGGPTPTYAWTKNGLPVGNSSNTYSVSNLNNGDRIKVKMTSSATCPDPGFVDSNEIIMALTVPRQVSVSVTGPPGTICGSPSFEAHPTNGGTNPTYTWYKNGSVVTDNGSPFPQIYAPFVSPSTPWNNNNKVTCVIQSNEWCISNTTATSNEVTASVIMPQEPIVNLAPSTLSICEGANISFTATGLNATLSNFQWTVNNIPAGTNSATLTTNQFTSNQSVVSVTATASGECLARNTATKTSEGIPITVTPLVGSTTSPAGILTRCQGGGTNRYYTTAANASNYTWEISPTSAGTINSWTQTLTVLSGFADITWNPEFSGTATITANAIGCGPQKSASINVVVTPTVSLGGVSLNTPLPICQGSSGVSFSAVAPANTTGYEWSLSNGGSSVLTPNGSTATVNWASSFAGTATVQLRALGCNGPTPWRSITVSVTPTVTQPTINGPASLCSGSGISQYTASNNNTPGYNWSITPSSAGTINPTSGLVTWSSSYVGAATIKVTANGCNGPSPERSYPVTINGRPAQANVLQPYYVNHGSSAYLEATGATANETYHWYATLESQTPLGTTTTPALNANITYYVAVSNPITGCESSIRTPFLITVNYPPVTNAGEDQTFIKTIGLQITINGSATDNDVPILYNWAQISPPAPLTDNTSPSLVLRNLKSGVYVFRLTATDNRGASSSDETIITINDPANNYNYVREIVPQIYGQKDVVQLPSLAFDKKVEGIKYFDGLGRPSQSIQIQGSPTGRDVVQPVVYDELGREAVKYLPYVAIETNGYYKLNPLGPPGNYIGSIQYNFYKNDDATDKIAEDPSPFAKIIFEPNPLSRPVKQGAPGSVWQPDEINNYPSTDHTVKFSYETNTQNEVLLFHYDNTSGLLSLQSSAKYYEPSRLHRKVTIDEQQHEVIEYTDKEGRTLCKKVEHGTGVGNAKLYASTYYVYDDFGNLTLVLPPEAIRNIEQN
jgi:hypothetical protein